MNPTRSLGLPASSASRDDRIRYLNLSLAAIGQPWFNKDGFQSLGFAGDLALSLSESDVAATAPLCAVDQRLQEFIDIYLAGARPSPKLPHSTLILDRHGLARELSLPPDADEYKNASLSSHRLFQGVLHNPAADRRTTQGVFHVAEGGLPVPADKKSVPRDVFARFLHAAFTAAPPELMELPYTGTCGDKAKCFVSLLLRPLVQPEIPGVLPRRTMEIRFFAPGGLVSNLDFVESIFGNAGNPAHLANDAALDPEHWSGHTGCVILAPHLQKMTKKELGLPHASQATERQKRDGMCWNSEDEIYNDGQAFKICARDERGVIVTIITDNYYGYCKKEVKTQISYAANLLGLCEEEHAGGALAFSSWAEGQTFRLANEFRLSHADSTFRHCLGDKAEFFPEGHGRDLRFPQIWYVPAEAQADIPSLSVSWPVAKGKTFSLKLIPGRQYVYPSGYKLSLERHPVAPSWRLVGINAEGTVTHKPSTVSGGGKSEIAKSLYDAIRHGPLYIEDFDADMALVDKVINSDIFARRYITPPLPLKGYSRPVLSPERSLGSVIKMLTPSTQFTEEYNKWLKTIPHRIKALVFIIKRFHQPDWGANWQRFFSVLTVNGESGHELMFQGRKLVGEYLRVGTDTSNGSWRTFKLRQNFLPAAKIQLEDDITASAVVPASAVAGLPASARRDRSLKFVENCEHRFFQRPDDAVVRGYDKQAEIDLSSSGLFCSNFQPLSRDEAEAMVDDAISFEEYSQPVRDLLKSFLADPKSSQVVDSSHARIVDGGKRSKNPRYLQVRPDHIDAMPAYLAEVGSRLFRQIPAGAPVPQPVGAVLPGRRNNPPEKGIRSLAVYGPLHWQELPELFMDFISSLTGKSPSTTGAGSEGALTKGPFNALVATTDLNNCLLGYILCGFDGWSSAAGSIGHRYKVEHDVSLLVPEIFCRLSPSERDPQRLIAESCLEKLEDFQYEGRLIPASRLGWRITAEFSNHYLGRIFDSPDIVFPDDMLRPEQQSLAEFVDGIENIAEAHRRVALEYFETNAVEAAIPPLQALLHIMAHGQWKGHGLHSPEVRDLFKLDSVLSSDWYQARLDRKAQVDREYCQKVFVRLARLREDRRDTLRPEIRSRLEAQQAWLLTELSRVSAKDYPESLRGTIGADLLCRK